MLEVGAWDEMDCERVAVEVIVVDDVVFVVVVAVVVDDDAVIVVDPCGVVAVMTISVVLVVYIEIEGTMCKDSDCGCCVVTTSTGLGASVTAGVFDPVGPKCEGTTSLPGTGPVWGVADVVTEAGGVTTGSSLSGIIDCDLIVSESGSKLFGRKMFIGC